MLRRRRAAPAASPGETAPPPAAAPPWETEDWETNAGKTEAGASDAGTTQPPRPAVGPAAAAPEAEPGWAWRKPAKPAAPPAPSGVPAAQSVIAPALPRRHDAVPAIARAVYASPDGEVLAVVARDGRLAIRSIRDGRLGLAREDIASRLYEGAGVSFAAGPGIMAFSTGPYAEIVRLDDLTVLPTPGIAQLTALSGDGTRLARIITRRTGDAWEDKLVVQSVTGSGQATVLLPDAPGEHRGDRHHLAFSPGGRLLALTTRSCTVQVLDAELLEDFRELPGHRETITGLEWLGPDVLATSSLDRTIRIWDVAEGRALRVFEADDRVLGITGAPAQRAVVGWTAHEYLAWASDTGQIVARGRLAIPAQYLDRPVAVTADSIVLAGPRVTDIEFIPFAGAASAEPEVSTYANAKVLLLGDSGVGKSGLAMVLAGDPFQATESTHARRIWAMPADGAAGEATTGEREILLWDLAGQPGYRIVHQLHLRDGAVAMVLFDARSETTPLAGIGHWARALRHAHGGGLVPAFLVAARTDRGVVGVSDERIAQVVTEFGFRGCLRTSAREGWGITELREAVLAAIDWDQIPVVTSSVLFAAAKSFVLGQKSAGTLLTPLPALCAGFLAAPVTGPAAEAAPSAQVGRDLMESGRAGEDDESRLRSVFEGCADRLESAGLVRRLAFGDLVLLQPELIDVYAGAVVNAARAEPDGLGCLAESGVLAVDFPIPEGERVADPLQERLLIIATLEELTRHEIVLREETDEGALLVFPSAFRRDLPAADEPDGYATEFGFEGPVDNLYATLVVRLARSDRFSRLSAWQSTVQFAAEGGGRCTLRLAMAREGVGTLRVSYDGGVPELVQVQFERFVQAHLERRATPGTARRRRQYACPDCGSPFSAAQAGQALSRGRDAMVCPACESRVSLDDPFTRLGQQPDAVTRQMDASADSARSRAAASSVILGKEETTDFDVFLCHHQEDKPAVQVIGQRLREKGKLPWLDVDELQPGRPWQDELERQIASIRAAAVFVGPAGLGPWQNHELRAFLRQFTERGCPVIPVLLPGAEPLALPVFLSGMTWVDLRDEDPAGIDRLIWGITGSKPARLESGST